MDENAGKHTTTPLFFTPAKRRHHEHHKKELQKRNVKGYRKEMIHYPKRYKWVQRNT